MAELHDDHPKDECGVVGLYAPDREAARLAFFSLFALQHRGQESAGIAVSDGDKIKWHRSMGLVSQVFNEDVLGNLPGEMAVAHTRYSTAGASVLRNAQPIYCQSVVGDIAVAHNGNLINAHILRAELEADGERFDTTSDSEVLARILVRHIGDGVIAAVNQVLKKAKGAYSVTVLLPDKVIGFRDPFGIRPLSAAKLGENGWILASETCAFNPVAGETLRELEPGEIAVIDKNGIKFHQGEVQARQAMCLFEFIYFARPDSIMYGTSLYRARERMGENLAKEHPVEADIVVPVPDSGIPAALGYSKQSGIPFKEGMVKSRYIHRTFIAPDQSMRDMGVRLKLTPIVDHIAGKRIVLVDDSIVRGTTTKQIVKLLFDSGAKEVHVRITAPPIKFPCFYGIDMATKNELAAARMSLPELCESIGASSLGFLSIKGAVSAVGKEEDQFCLACFTGNYPIPIPGNLKRDAFEEVHKTGELAAITGSQPPLFADVP